MVSLSDISIFLRYLFVCLIPPSPVFHRSLQVAGRDGRRVTLSGVEVGATDVYRCELVAEGPPFHTTQRSANMTVVGECESDGGGPGEGGSQCDEGW